MDEYLKKLQEKYGYNNELIVALGKIIPAFIEHYGDEYKPLILDAISSCEIHMQQENEIPAEYLSKFFPDNDKERVPTIAVAFLTSMPIVTNEGISSKRLVYLTLKGSSDWQNETTISSLVHEIGHLIKAYNKEYSISDGKMQKRNGIATTVINRDEKTGKYVSGEEKKHVGLEEAINCFDEEKIMSIILGRQFKVSSYFHRLNEGIEPLFAHQELVTIFRNSQLKGTNEHIKYLGAEGFEILSEHFENLYFVVTQPYFAKRQNNGEKSVGQLLGEAKSRIAEYAAEYGKKKEQNFSGDALGQLDTQVSYADRNKGMGDLRDGMCEGIRLSEEGKNSDDFRI